MKRELRASFILAETSDTELLLVDMDRGVSVTNDAEAVIEFLGKVVPNGLDGRRVYYRDTDGRFDELRVKGGAFSGFSPVTPAQQANFAARCQWLQGPPYNPLLTHD